MLKWAVNQPRPSYLELHPGKTSPTPAATPMSLQPTKLRRHSLLPQLGEGKENHAHSLCHAHSHSTLTSTPLPAAATRAPLLRDVSNIMSPLQTPCATPTAPRRSQLKLKPAVYASTLPTFEAEYSPSYRPSGSSELVPGPLLALRGVGIPDSYFEKPRYLEQKPLPPLSSTRNTDAASEEAAAAAPPPPGEATLRSSQMGDVTLERMIDAILESTRKPPTAPAGVRYRRRSRSRAAGAGAGAARPPQRPQRRLISPTYRPAFDPASDLCEYWQSADPTPAAAAAAATVLCDGYEEREVRSPQFPPGSAPGQSKRRSLQLRRQRVVRRKRKITTKISSSVRQSAQKLLAAASRSAQKLPPVARSAQRHISPDSGHNSTSDCELEYELEEPLGLGDEQLEAACKLDAMWMQSEAVDATKRRLSFSLHDDDS